MKITTEQINKINEYTPVWLQDFWSKPIMQMPEKEVYKYLNKQIKYWMQVWEVDKSPNIFTHTVGKVRDNWNAENVAGAYFKLKVELMARGRSAKYWNSVYEHEYYNTLRGYTSL